MKDKIITAILVIIVGIILLPLAKFNDTQETQELKGFTERDIYYIESIGFVDNGDGTWTLNINSNLPPLFATYWFEYQPLGPNGKIMAMAIRTSSDNQLQVVVDGSINIIVGPTTYTLYGGDVS
jgi:hypothetical protein